jgi:hypothetical protein
VETRYNQYKCGTREIYLPSPYIFLGRHLSRLDEFFGFFLSILPNSSVPFLRNNHIVGSGLAFACLFGSSIYLGDEMTSFPFLE